MDHELVQQRSDDDLSANGAFDSHKFAAEVANKVVMEIIANIKPGNSVYEICCFGDKMITDLCAQKYLKLKPLEKGVAFPTCISVNNCASYFCPMPDDPPVTLNTGDMVKIDLGVHINGYASQCATTMIVGQNPSTKTPEQGRLADVICATHFAAECAHRLLRPGTSNFDVTRAIQAVADVFHCSPVEGVMSHQLKRNNIEGQVAIATKLGVNQHVSEHKFAVNEAYCIDIMMSTGSGKPRELLTKSTVFKRSGVNYGLKVHTSRQLFHDITQNFPVMPFALRSLDEKKRKLGIVEIAKYKLVESYPVMWEQDGEHICQFKFTALVLPSGTQRLSSFPLPFVASQYSIDSNPQLKELLGQPASVHIASGPVLSFPRDGGARQENLQRRKSQKRLRSRSRGKAEGGGMDLDT